MKSSFVRIGSSKRYPVNPYSRPVSAIGMETFSASSTSARLSLTYTIEIKRIQLIKIPVVSQRLLTNLIAIFDFISSAVENSFFSFSMEKIVNKGFQHLVPNNDCIITSSIHNIVGISKSVINILVPLQEKRVNTTIKIIVIEIITNDI